MSRRVVGGELGAVVDFIFEVGGLMPVYIDGGVAVYRNRLVVDKCLARFGSLRGVRVCYCGDVVCFVALEPKSL